MKSESRATAPRSHLLLLALIVGFAAALRIFSLPSLGYWTDEFCTLSCAHGWGLQFDNVPVNHILPPRPVMTRLSSAQPIFEIIPAMARDEAHPPLYFLLVRLWESLLGDSEAAVRSLNVIFSLAAIVLLFFAAKDSIGNTAALWACLLMAVAEPQIQFSQEARNYMPAVTLSLVATLAIQRLKRRISIPIATTLAGSLLAMMLTHYFAAGVAVALGIFAMNLLRGRARWVALAAFFSAAVLFVLLWGSFFLRQLPHFRSNYAWIADASPDRFRHLAANLCRLPWRLVAEMPKASPLQDAVMILGGGFLVLLPVAFIRRPELRLWIVWFSASVGLVVGVDLFRSTAQLVMLRYTLFATPAMYVLIAGWVRRGRAAFALPAVAMILALLSLPGAYTPAWKTDYRTPVQFVGRSLGPDDGLVIIGPDEINDGIMFAAFQHYLPAMPAAMAVLTTQPDAPTLAKLRQCPHVWLVRLWPNGDVKLPGFKVQDQQSVPYFADLMVGTFQ